MENMSTEDEFTFSFYGDLDPLARTSHGAYTVRTLIEALQALPPELHALEVQLEGDDGSAPCGGIDEVIIEEEGKRYCVLLFAR